MDYLLIFLLMFKPYILPGDTQPLPDTVSVLIITTYADDNGHIQEDTEEIIKMSLKMYIRMKHKPTKAEILDYWNTGYLVVIISGDVA
jgi:hypothetical protein